MKFNFSLQKRNYLCILIALMSISIISAKRDSLFQNNFNLKNNNFSIEEIQNQLSNFISRIETIRKTEEQNQLNSNSLIKIDIKQIYDLRTVLESYFILYNDFLNLKNRNIEEFKSKIEFFDKNLKELSNSISKTDQIHKSEIDKAALISKEISSKNKSNFELISEIESLKSNFENENKKEINFLKDSKFAQVVDENSKNSSKNVLNNFHTIYKENQENIKSRLNTTLQQINSSNKISSLKTEESFLSDNKNSNEFDLKIINLILENIKFNYNKFKEEVTKKIESLEKLKKISNKSINIKQLQKEKEESKEILDKNIKELVLKQNELKDIMKNNEKLLSKRKILTETLNKKIIEKKILFGEKTKKLNSYNDEIKEIEKKRKNLKSNEKNVSKF